MRFRPGLVADYRSDAAILRTGTQRLWVGVLAVVLVLLGVGAGIPLIPGVFSLNLESDLLILAVTAAVAAIGALGLNIISGFAGQVSLGHAFFLGIGAFTAALLGGEEVVRSVSTGEIVRGYGLDMIIWLPAAGLVAALCGLVVAPVAFRLKGLYLAFVTLGLVFVGGHLFRQFKGITGGVGLGRETAVPSLLGFRFDQDGDVFGVYLSAEQKHFFLALILLTVMAVIARNLARSRIGRALAAIRDRDIAAEIMGISLTRYKTIAFVVSSFYAGIAGALLFSVIGRLEPSEFGELPGLLLSVEYIAMVLIGGISTVSGSIMGAVFIVFLPRVVEELARSGILGFIGQSAGSGILDISQFARVLFGAFVVFFLIIEPLGLYGIWIRVRNYWKAFPFSY